MMNLCKKLASRVAEAALECSSNILRDVLFMLIFCGAFLLHTWEKKREFFQKIVKHFQCQNSHFIAYKILFTIRNTHFIAYK